MNTKFIGVFTNWGYEGIYLNMGVIETVVYNDTEYFCTSGENNKGEEFWILSVSSDMMCPAFVEKVGGDISSCSRPATCIK